MMSTILDCLTSTDRPYGKYMLSQSVQGPLFDLQGCYLPTCPLLPILLAGSVLPGCAACVDLDPTGHVVVQGARTCSTESRRQRGVYACTPACEYRAADWMALLAVAHREAQHHALGGLEDTGEDHEGQRREEVGRYLTPHPCLPAQSRLTSQS